MLVTSAFLTQVSAGDPIGTAVESPCATQNHIHFAIRRNGGAVDPSEFLESRPIQKPEWVQICDDYKLVFKVNSS